MSYLINLRYERWKGGYDTIRASANEDSKSELISSVKLVTPSSISTLPVNISPATSAFAARQWMIGLSRYAMYNVVIVDMMNRWRCSDFVPESSSMVKGLVASRTSYKRVKLTVYVDCTKVDDRVYTC